MPSNFLTDLLGKLENNLAPWEARETPQSLLEDILKKNLMGAVPDETSAAAVQAVAADSAAFINTLMAPGAILPASIDWRNNSGNFVTPVKDQGNCGSCVSFGTCAVIESMIGIEGKGVIILSEADSHFCSVHGANCNGWWPNNAFDQDKARGVVPDNLFPYATAFPSDDINCSVPGGGSCNVVCYAVPNHDNAAVKITTWTAHTDIQDKKTYLANVGPMAAIMDVYDDFMNYSSGIYNYVSGAMHGSHCIQVIGYSDTDGCWICKNSWGVNWGTAGFFEIKYGECNIDTNAFFGCTGIILPTV